MEKNIFSGRCETDCPHAGRGNLSTRAGEGGSVSLETDGTLSYISAGPCGIRAGRIGAALVANQDPSLYGRIGACEGPVASEMRVPRKVLGLLGLKKTITVTECPAASSQELLQIAHADAEGI